MAVTEGESEIGEGSNSNNNNNNMYQSIARGGPLYLPNLVSSLTNPPLFQLHLLSELTDLRKELGQDFSDFGEDDLLTDELKIVTEEELVDKAFDIAFREDEAEKCPEVSEECLDERNDSAISSDSQNNAIRESSGRGIDGASLDDTSCGPSVQSDAKEGLSKAAKKKKGKNQKSQNNNEKRKRKRKSDDSPTGDKKRRRKRRKKETVEDSYIAKVKELVRIKEKQLEDKAATKLRSFNGGCRIDENAMISSDRTTSLRSNNSTAKARISSSHDEQVLQPGKEVVLCVEVYHNKRTWQKTQEFLVLGRQSLTELRDKIYCLTDQLMERAGQHDSSGYFFIEDVFYNDMRDASTIDYSSPILDWLNDSKKEALEKWEYILSGRLQPKQKALVDNSKEENLPRFTALQMHKKFCDLKFRLGAGYLYCHQGDCKHTIIIRDMRLIHPEDIQDRNAYPVNTFQIKPRIRKCSVCQIFRAKLVTVDDKWAGENPCYFCDACYYMLHYADESLLYPDFSVYDYHHDQI